MSLAPQIISASPGTPQGTVQALADIQRTINALTAEAGNLHPRSISADRIEVNAITATEIQAGTITATQIATDAITATKIQAGAVTGAGTGGTGEIASATITGFNIEAGTVSADRIVAHDITAAQIAATSIDASRLNVGTLQAITGNMGTLSSGVISLAGGTVVISDTLGITINAGAGGINNITWLSGAQTVGKLAMNTISTTSFGSLETRSPNGVQFAALTLDADNTGGGILQEVKVNTSGAGPATLMCSAGYGLWPGGIGMYGTVPPGARPANPTTLAQVITILQGYGMCL